MVRSLRWIKYNHQDQGAEELMIELRDVIDNAQYILEHDGGVHLIIEPGDATHYEFVIIDLPNQNKQMVSSYVDGWASEIHRLGYVHPENMVEYVRFKVNPNTVAVITDLINMIHGDTDRYFDWVAGGMRREPNE